jgi:GNAT superfamily N-acetyltransferase
MSVAIRVLGPHDAPLLARVSPGVFDRGIDQRLCIEFLADPRHHLAVAIESSGVVVGFASAVHYVHPDKPPEMWMNEIGVAAPHRRRGVGKRLLHPLFEVARELGCREAWVLTDRGNEAAMRLYASAGASAPPRDQVMFTFKLT